MIDRSHVKAIVFDAYGTLFDISTIDRRLAEHFGDQGPRVAALWRRKQLEYTWLRTLMNRYRPFYALTADALVYACEALALPAAPALIDDLMDHYRRLSVYSDVPDALHRLSRHFELAILSNADADLLERAVACNSIGGYLQAIFSVEVLGKYKPAPEVYRLPAAGLGIEPAVVLFVSANPWDVAGARSAGLRVAWVRRGAGVMEQLGFSPDLIIRHLTELADRSGQ